MSQVSESRLNHLHGSMNLLPQIFIFLEVPECANCALTSKEFLAASRSSVLVREHLRRLAPPMYHQFSQLSSLGIAVDWSSLLKLVHTQNRTLVLSRNARNAAAGADVVHQQVRHTLNNATTGAILAAKVGLFILTIFAPSAGPVLSISAYTP